MTVRPETFSMFKRSMIGLRLRKTWRPAHDRPSRTYDQETASMKIRYAAVTLLCVGALAACSDADVASRNLSTAADQFEINRRIVFYNGITGEYMLEVRGLCSLGNNDTSLRMSVTCKTGPDQFVKHYLGLSDNVTFFAEQIDPARVSTAQYRVIFKPSVIVPAIDLE